MVKNAKHFKCYKYILSKRFTFRFDATCLETFYSLRSNLMKITRFWASFSFSQLVIY